MMEVLIGLASDTLAHIVRIELVQMEEGVAIIITDTVGVAWSSGARWPVKFIVLAPLTLRVEPRRIRAVDPHSLAWRACHLLLIHSHVFKLSLCHVLRRMLATLV